MKKGLIISACVCVAMILFASIFTRLAMPEEKHLRKYQHEENSDADSSIGSQTVGKDGYINKDEFVTHLPLVIIDTNGKQVPNIYKYGTSNIKQYIDENVTDPYIDATISIINNDNYQNHITDTPEILNNGKIKLRGVSSRSFAKKQYGIKFMDDNGEELELPVLGMEADEDWVLSNSLLDASMLRNYIAYNIGGQIFTNTSEAKFCEVIMKEGDRYNYIGLYLLTESVKKADGRVNINDFDNPTDDLSYLICRDRADSTKLTLDTYASTNQICYGYFTVKYPKEELLTDTVVKKIESELSKIEKIIYSDDNDIFKNYVNYIDVNSFVDYFVFNEFMMCYDSGDNSTYYYRDSAHKLSMGPLWDYDNCFDNYKLDTGDPEYAVYVLRPWFEKLIKDPEFQKKVCRRYNELRTTILSDEYIEQFIDDTIEYLGNATDREWSRWRSSYMESCLLNVMEDGQGYLVDRNKETYEEEVQRLKDVEKMHSAWLDEYLDDFLSEYTDEDLYRNQNKNLSYIAVGAFIAFGITIAMVRKRLIEG